MEISQRIFVYRVDKHDRISFVSSEWISFARENHVPQTNIESFVGQPLMQFIAGEETKQLYEMILERVRSSKRPLSFPFNCDAPAIRRFMKLEISPLADDEVEFSARLIEEEQREPIPLFDLSIDRADEFLLICSWCKRIQVSEEWVDVEEAVSRMRLFDTYNLPALTHGICADCLKTVTSELERSIAN